MRFVGKRLALFVAALVGLSALVFRGMLRVSAGDVAAVMAGTNATARTHRVAARTNSAWTGRSLAQYADWMAGMLHGDLGVSAVGGRLGRRGRSPRAPPSRSL